MWAECRESTKDSEGPEGLVTMPEPGGVWGASGHVDPETGLVGKELWLPIEGPAGRGLWWVE